MSPGVVGKKQTPVRDPQLPEAEGAWEKEKRKLSVKNSPASMGCGLGKVVLPG